MTWGEFKRKVEEKIKDEDMIDTINYENGSLCDVQLDQCLDGKLWVIFNSP